MVAERGEGDASERALADRDARRVRVRPAGAPRYGRGTGYERVEGPPMPSASEPPRKSKVHSILSALPIIMLVAGLYFHYSGERAQSAGAPILVESVDARGTFEGFSVVRSGGRGRHYLWFDDGTRRRGARVTPAQHDALDALGASDALVAGDELLLRLAPTVSGSGTLWAWRIERDGAVLLDDSGRLR